jgi:hypothetical protein
MIFAFHALYLSEIFLVLIIDFNVFKFSKAKNVAYSIKPAACVYSNTVLALSQICRHDI